MRTRIRCNKDNKQRNQEGEQGHKMKTKIKLKRKQEDIIKEESKEEITKRTKR